MLAPVEQLPVAKQAACRDAGIVAADPDDGRYVVRTMLRLRWSERGYVMYDKRGRPVAQVYALSCEDAIAQLDGGCGVLA